MPEPITSETVRHIASLARLRVDEDRIGTIAEQMTTILHYFDALAQVDAKHIEPMDHPMDRTNCLRADTIGPMLPKSAAEQIAPEMQHGLFAVPKVIGEGSA